MGSDTSIAAVEQDDGTTHTLLTSIAKMWQAVQDTLNHYPNTSVINLALVFFWRQCCLSIESFAAKLKMMFTHYSLIQEDLYTLWIRECVGTEVASFVFQLEFKDGHTIRTPKSVLVRVE